MKQMLKAAALAVTLSLACATPALADDPWPTDTGDYVEVGMISVADGHDLDYMNFLAGQWRKTQDFAKAQGWITGYEILANLNKRQGEPDYYLITRFARIPDKAEEKKRDEAYDAYIKMTQAELLAGSAERAKYRTQMGSQMLCSLVWKK